jgi:hypothetical protein
LACLAARGLLPHCCKVSHHLISIVKVKGGIEMQITDEDIMNAKKAYEDKLEIDDDSLATLYAKALTRNSKKFPELPQKVKYVALKQDSGKYILDWRGTDPCSADGRP